DSAPAPSPYTADRSPTLAFATDDLVAAGPATPEDVVRARQFARMASAQVHSLLESIERELGRLGANPAPAAPAPQSPEAPAEARPARAEWRPGDIDY
ncbi:hypothetical protein JNB62_16660, partial [Microbacterium jejuense]|nr:hypothetical protein [Microbacterium jejuense]